MLLLIVIFGFADVVNVAYAPQGTRIDTLRVLTIKGPDAQLIGIKTDIVDLLEGMLRPADIEELGALGYTITNAPGYNIAHIGINLRLPVLDDVAFRHALLHAYDQYGIIATIYGYTVTPIDSLVPPAQAGWHNPNIPTHPYNHGDMDSLPGEESVFGILYEAGYTYHGTGYGDLSAYWLTPEGDPIPDYELWTPTYETAITEAKHGALITEEWHRCGLNTLTHVPCDPGEYRAFVIDEQYFDMYMIEWRVGRFPDQLFDMCHSSQDVPGGHNAVGLHDPVLDPWLETVKFSLDHEEKLGAAFNAQAWMYDETNPWAFPYLHMYSRNIFNAFDPQLAGIVNSVGYGSWNDWTLYNIHWHTPNGYRPGTTEKLVIYCNGDEPASLNPLQASTVYEWNIINPTQTGLIQVNPYTHTDLPWVATDWIVEGPWSGTAPNGVPIVEGMKITYNLRDDVYWQDGTLFTADDCVFSLEFLRDNAIPRYTAAWESIVDVHANSPTSFTVYSDVTGQFFLYDWAGLATLLPPQVWAEWDGMPLPDILGYEVWKDTRPTGTTPTPYRLFGLGPMIFQFYNETGMYADLTAFDHWFLSTAEIETMKAEMFHKIGDVNYDGCIDDLDQSQMSYAFGYYLGEAEYDPDADLDSDGFVGPYDSTLISFYFGERRTYPLLGI
jgi:ABC-type transport system substrate-binding protein